MKTRRTTIEKLLDVFTLKNVRARYARIGHKPIRGWTSLPGRTASCLLGSFEHFLRVDAVGDTINLASATGLSEKLLRAVEAGWEGWKPTRNSGEIGWECGRPRPMPKVGSPERRAYQRGQYLARKMHPVLPQPWRHRP